MHKHSPSLSIFLLAIASQASAQVANIEEITVSASFRQSTLNQLALSAAVLGENLIATKNALHLEDILTNAPNVNLSSGASRARFYQIRGIGERGQFTEPMNASVGVLIDGVDFSGIGGAAMLYDVEQVEVLMGPQGTRYGSNALAGLINLQSKNPGTTTAYGLQLQAENYDSTGLAGYITGKLDADLSARLSFQTLQSDGFSNNLFLNKPTNYRDETSLRGKLHWQTSSSISTDLTLAHIDIDNGYDAFSLDNIRDTRSDEPGVDQQKSTLASLKVKAEGSSLFSMEFYAAYANSDTVYGYDEDWTYTGFHPWEYSSTDRYDRDRQTRSAEIRLLSGESGNIFKGATSWVAGLYRLEQDVSLQRQYTYLSNDFFSDYSIDRSALYADTTTELTGALSFEAGFRVERFTASYTDTSALGFTPSDTLYGGRLGLNYTLQSGNLLYLNVSRGYKTGGFNTDGSLDADLREFGEESLLNYEAGFKGYLLDNRLSVQAALFWMDRQDVQISSSTVRMRNDGSAEFIDYTGNAAAGFNRGMELSFDWNLHEQLNLYGNLGLLNSKYENFTNSAGENLDGRAQAHAPDYQYTIGAAWDLLPQLSIDLNLQGRDAFYFSDSHNIRSDRYTLLNASMLWHWNNTKVRLWGRNLTDADYAVRGYFFGNDPRDNYTAKGYTQPGEPLRYGLTINMDF